MDNILTQGSALFTKVTVSVLLAQLLEKLDLNGYLFIILIFFMIADYISAIIAAKQEKLEHPEDETKGWSSKKAKKGTYHKLQQMIIIVACMLLDEVINLVAPQMGVAILEGFKFTFVILVYYVGAEFISIIENVNKGTEKAAPQWLVTTIKWLDTSFGKYIATLLKETKEEE